MSHDSLKVSIGDVLFLVTYDLELIEASVEFFLAENKSKLLKPLPDSVASGMLSEHQIVHMYADRLRSHDLISLLIGKHAVLMYTGLGIYCVVEHRRSVKYNRKEIKRYLGRAVELAKQLTNAVNDYGPMIIDEKYTDPRILEKLMLINRSGRTDTLEQAIDMLYHESGRTKEEDQAYLDKITSRQAEFGETKAKVFCSANFFGLYHKDQEPLKK